MITNRVNDFLSQSQSLSKLEKALTIKDDYFKTFNDTLKKHIVSPTNKLTKKIQSNTEETTIDKHTFINVKRLIHHIEEYFKKEKNDVEAMKLLLVYIDDGMQLCTKKLPMESIERTTLMVQLQSLKDEIQPAINKLRQEEFEREEAEKRRREIEELKRKRDSIEENLGIVNKSESPSDDGDTSKVNMKRPVSFHSRRIQGHLRRELLKEIQLAEAEQNKHAKKEDLFDNPPAVQSDAKFDRMQQELMQEELTSEVKLLAEALKQRALDIQDSLAKDNAVIDEGFNLFDSNLAKVQSEQKNLVRHNANVRWGILRSFSMLIFVIAVFFLMLLIIWIFPKR
jgi:hypothetical protein